jgi:outer membrane lipoprotein-sorting protein
MRLNLVFIVGLLLAAAGLGLISVTQCAASPNGKLDQILANMQRAARTLRTFRAHLTHEKRHTQIGGREFYEGTITFKHVSSNKDKVRIVYTNGQEVLIDGNRLMLYQPRIKQAFVSTRQAQAAKNPDLVFFATPYSSLPKLRSYYNVVYLRDEQVGGFATSVLELTPKVSSAAVKEIIWVDQASWLPIRFQVVERNGDVSTFTLSNIEKNVKLSDGDFQLNLPSGTRVIKQ